MKYYILPFLFPISLSQVSVWTQVHSGDGYAPSQRDGSSVAIENTSGDMIMFGGNNNTSTRELWRFNFNTRSWNLLSDSTGPGARTLQVSTMRSKGDFCIYGGFSYNTESWSFNLTTNIWSLIASGYTANVTPYQRNRYDSAYRESKDEMLLYGGIGSGSFYYQDFWGFSFTTKRWTLYSATNPPGLRQSYVCEMHPYEDKYLLQGGYDGSTVYGDFWEYDFKNSSWTLLTATSTTSALRRWKHASGMNKLDGEMYIFGGIASGYSSDFWKYDFKNATWISIPFTNGPPLRQVNGADFRHSSRDFVIFGGSGQTSKLNDVWAFRVPAPLKVSTTTSATTTFATTTLLITSSSIGLSSSRPLSRSVTSLTSLVLGPPASPSASNSEMLAGSPSNEILEQTSETDTSDTFEGTVATMTVVDKDNSSVSSSQTLKLVVILAVVAFLFLCFTIFVLSKLNLRKQINRKDSQPQNEETSTTTSMGTGTEYGSSTSTLMMTNVGLALPAFLNFTTNDYRKREQIAQGGFGRIYLGESLRDELAPSGCKIIVKEMIPRKTLERDIQLMLQEVSIMYYLRENRNIVKVLGYSEFPYAILMRYYKYGSLRDWIKTSTSQKTKTIQHSFANDIAIGMNAMHRAGFLHSDIKPENILLDVD